MDKILEKIKSFRIYEGTRPLDIYQFNRQQGSELIRLIEELLNAQKEACAKEFVGIIDRITDCGQELPEIIIRLVRIKILNAEVSL